VSYCALIGTPQAAAYTIQAALKIIDLAIDLPSEEASVSYPECTCIL